MLFPCNSNQSFVPAWNAERLHGHSWPLLHTKRGLSSKGATVNIHLGEKFGRLVVIGFSHKSKGNQIIVNCRCECGTVKAILISSLVGKKTKSCGCLRLDKMAALFTTHGEAKRGLCSTEYNSWAAMIQRCLNKNRKKYPNYGGRGIKVCDRWRLSFIDFLADMGRKPSPKHSLDRINNDGNYEPGNCKWSTNKEQSNNRRNRWRKIK